MAGELDSKARHPGREAHDRSSGEPTLRGLVLAGGGSTRMGRDKGLLEYHGKPQVLWLTGVLSRLCATVHVSVSPAQRTIVPYSELPTVVDLQPARGPASGLLAAWATCPDAAWLAVAVDLPFVDEKALGVLVAGRSPARLATAFRHPSGVLEPVCTLWEPAAQPLLEGQVAAGDGSLRRVLEAGPVEALPAPGPGILSSVNTPEAYREALAVLAGHAPGLPR